MNREDLIGELKNIVGEQLLLSRRKTSSSMSRRLDLSSHAGNRRAAE